MLDFFKFVALFVLGALAGLAVLNIVKKTSAYYNYEVHCGSAPKHLEMTLEKAKGEIWGIFSSRIYRIETENEVFYFPVDKCFVKETDYVGDD